MLNKRSDIWSIVFSCIGISLLIGKGWFYENFEGLSYLIAYHIMGYAVAPCFSLVAAIKSHGSGGIIRQFFWSIFSICLVYFIDNSYCRIPNNDVCDNDYFTTFFVICTIVYMSYKMMKIMNDRGKGMIIGFGLGFSVAKTILHKTWLGKLFIALIKIFGL